MSKTTGVVLTLASGIVGFFAFLYFAPRSAPFGMFEGAEQSGTVRLVVTFTATIAGVVCGSLYRELRQLQAVGIMRIKKPREFIGGMFTSVDLWLGLAGSPIVYALLLKSSDGMTLSGLVVVALENGFCCLLILNGLMGKAGAPATSPSGTT